MPGDVSDFVTIYAAAVASAALGWQVWTWRQSRRKVRVTARLGAAAFPVATVWSVTIAVVNRSDHVVNVSSLGLEMQDGSKRQWLTFRPLPISTLPGAVNPHDSGELYIDARAAEQDFELDRPVVAWARLATGDIVRSKRASLLAHGARLPGADD